MLSKASIRWYIAPLATVFCILAIVGLIYGSIEGVFSYDDGIRHFTLAQMLASNGAASFSGWGDFLYSGYFSEIDLDPWFLSHIVIMPLASLGVIAGMKMFVLISIALLCIIYASIGRSIGLSSKLTSMFLMILIMEYSMFYARLHLARPYVLMIAITVLVIWSIIHRKIYWVFPLLALGTLLSHLFMMPLIIASWGCIWLWSIGERGTGVRLAVVSLAGVALGIILHPQSLNYAHYIATTFYVPLLLNDIGKGNEIHSGLDIAAMPAAMIGMITLWLAVAIHNGKTTLKKLQNDGISFVYFTSYFLVIGVILVARTIDFAWPVIILLMMMAVAIDPHAPAISAKKIFPGTVCKRGIFLCLLFVFPLISIGKMYSEIQTSNYSPSTYTSTLKGIPSGSKILNIDWAIFSLLFSVRQDLTYARGMDPTFDFITDIDKARLFVIPLHKDREYLDAQKWLEDLLEGYEGDYLAIWNPYHPDLVGRIQDFDVLEMHFDDGEDGFTIFRIDRSLRAK